MTATSPNMHDAVLADTGPLYALADPSDQYHRRARRELNKLNRAGSIVSLSYPTMCESYTLVLRRLGITYARQWLEELAAGTQLLNPEVGDYEAAANLIRRYEDQEITLFDGIIAAISRRFGLPVWSYDRHFRVIGVQAWTTS